MTQYDAIKNPPKVGFWFVNFRYCKLLINTSYIGVKKSKNMGII